MKMRNIYIYIFYIPKDSPARRVSGGKSGGVLPYESLRFLFSGHHNSLRRKKKAEKLVECN